MKKEKTCYCLNGDEGFFGFFFCLEEKKKRQAGEAFSLRFLKSIYYKKTSIANICFRVEDKTNLNVIGIYKRAITLMTLDLFCILFSIKRKKYEKKVKKVYPSLYSGGQKTKAGQKIKKSEMK